MRLVLSVLLGGCLLAGCAGDPSVRDSALLVQVQARAERLSFVYRDVQMRIVSSYQYGSGARISNFGIGLFGKRLVEQAVPVFARHGVKVESAMQIDGGAALPDFQPAGGQTAPVLVIAPVKGEERGGTAGSGASYVFSAQLLDPASRRVLWKASIDTAAWVGHDFIMKNVEPKRYDAAQAEKLLMAIASKLAEDGLIRQAGGQS